MFKITGFGWSGWSDQTEHFSNRFLLEWLITVWSISQLVEFFIVYWEKPFLVGWIGWCVFVLCWENRFKFIWLRGLINLDQPKMSYWETATVSSYFVESLSIEPTKNWFFPIGHEKPSPTQPTKSVEPNRTWPKWLEELLLSPTPIHTWMGSQPITGRRPFQHLSGLPKNLLLSMLSGRERYFESKVPCP